VSAPPACLASYRKKPRNSHVCCARAKIGATRRDTRDGESADLYACRVVFSNAKRLGVVIGNCWRCVFSNFTRNLARVYWVLLEMLGGPSNVLLTRYDMYGCVHK